MKKGRFVAGLIGFLLVFFGLFAAAFFASDALAAYLKPLAPLVQFLLTLALGLVFFVIFILLNKLYGRLRGRPRGGGGRDHAGLDAELLDALQRIARGDFDVFISPEIYGVHIEIIDAINKMAEQLGTMESLRQDFISNVSHEIQSPLTSIGGFAKLLQDQGDRLSPTERAHYLAIIEAESKRLSKLSDNLMKLSTLESQDTPLNCGEFRLDRQLESVTLMLEPQWQAKRLEVEAELSPVTYKGDEELLAQVWVNLLNNAIKFTPEGGSLHIALSQDEQGHAIVRITDTGIGIAPEDRMHIFERFYKVDKARERAAGGNGLGLSLTKKILDLHKSHIDVESELGKGSTFIVSLSESAD